MSVSAELYDAILTGNAKKAEEATKAALAANIDPSDLVWNEMIPAMDAVGKNLPWNNYFMPELLVAVRAMKTSLALIAASPAKAGIQSIGRIVIGAVEGDRYDNGKALFATVLEGAGFQVVDLGVDVPPQAFADTAMEKEGSLIVLVAGPSTTGSSMKNVVDLLARIGLRDKTRVLIVGAGATEETAREIGADGHAGQASTAVSSALNLSKF